MFTQPLSVSRGTKCIGLLLHIIIISCLFNRDFKMVALWLLFFKYDRFYYFLSKG
nr:unnamed protein product [Callosobruchus analis]